MESPVFCVLTQFSILRWANATTKTCATSAVSG